LYSFFERLISLNFRQPPPYVEPYAGGGSLALSLLFKGKVSEIFLNDLDPAIYSFWISQLHHPEEFIDLIRSTPVTPSEWRKQKQIYARGLRSGRIRLGFATFFLNRTNHSGILNGGMIGGKSQAGRWRLDARYNRAELIERVRRISSYRDRVHLSNSDACDFLETRNIDNGALIYLDPPYYRAGRHLYFSYYRPQDHCALRDFIGSLRSPWVLSYDDHPETRKLYSAYRSRDVALMHTARTARIGREVMFFSERMRIPRTAGMALFSR
jgi:DNA adenine methylase